MDQPPSSESELPTHFLGTRIQLLSSQPALASARYDLGSDDASVVAVNTGTTNDNSGQDDNDRPPTPWGSSSSKQTIIEQLKEDTSDIHLLVGNYTTTDFSNVNFHQILQQY